VRQYIAAVMIPIGGMGGCNIIYDGEGFEIAIREDPDVRIRILPPSTDDTWAVWGFEHGQPVVLGNHVTLQEDMVNRCGLKQVIARLMRAAVNAMKLATLQEGPPRIDVEAVGFQEAFETIQLVPAQGEPGITIDQLAWYGREGWTFSLERRDGEGNLIEVVAQRRFMAPKEEIQDGETGSGPS
jgi:hypothetical protein